MLSIRNIGVVHGEWGESVAIEYLRHLGFEIIDRNSRPAIFDKRLEIDIVAWDQKTDTLVFVEVKQHSRVSKYAHRLRSITKRKCINLRRVCNAWRRKYAWRGDFRFDVIEIYGTPTGDVPIIDHIDHVDLFPRRGRFVKWC